jgi:hypothetical protein
MQRAEIRGQTAKGIVQDEERRWWWVDLRGFVVQAKYFGEKAARLKC